MNAEMMPQVIQPGSASRSTTLSDNIRCIYQQVCQHQPRSYSSNSIDRPHVAMSCPASKAISPHRHMCLNDRVHFGSPARGTNLDANCNRNRRILCVPHATAFVQARRVFIYKEVKRFWNKPSLQPRRKKHISC